MHSSYRALTLALVGLSALAAAPLHAQDAPAASGGEIVIVGRQDAAVPIESRGLSVSLGDEAFAGVNAATAEDLVKYAPDLFVRSRFIGDANAVPGLRATHSTQSARSLVLVDGFVISDFLGNSYDHPPVWGIVSPGEIARVDIVYGPYSAWYPGNSMGGIVSISTRRPTETEAFATVQGFAQDYEQYGTKNTYLGYSAEAGFALKVPDSPWGLRVSWRRLANESQPMQFTLLGYSPALYDDPAAGTSVTGATIDPELPPSADGVVPPVAGTYSPTQTRQDQARAQLRYDSGEMHAEALFAWWASRGEALHPQTYLRDANGEPFYGDASGVVRVGDHAWRLNPGSSFRLGVMHRNQWLAGLRLEGPVAGLHVRANFSTLRVTQQDERRSNGYAAGIADGPGQRTRQGPTGWMTGDLVATRMLGAHEVAFGLNANVYETDQSVFDTADWRAGSGLLATRTSGRTRTIGVFAEDAIRLGDGTLLTFGARRDWWRAYDGGLTGLAGEGLATQAYPVRSAAAFSPKLSLRHRFAGGLLAELSLATATRFPTVGELFQGSLRGDGSFDPDSFDPNLEPEKSRDANLLVRRAFGPLTLTGSLFYQRMEDAIFAFTGLNQNGITSSSFKNIDATRALGAELIAETRDWPAEGLDIDANAAWIDAVTTANHADPASEGVQFPRIPHWRLGGNLRWRVLPDVQAVVGIRYASRPNSDLDGQLRGDTYGYTSEAFALDLRANADVSETLRLSAGINNITNDRAWVYHPYPQRTFFLEAGVKL